MRNLFSDSTNGLDLVKHEPGGVEPPLVGSAASTNEPRAAEPAGSAVRRLWVPEPTGVPGGPGYTERRIESRVRLGEVRTAYHELHARAMRGQLRATP